MTTSMIPAEYSCFIIPSLLMRMGGKRVLNKIWPEEWWKFQTMQLVPRALSCLLANSIFTRAKVCSRFAVMNSHVYVFFVLDCWNITSSYNIITQMSRSILLATSNRIFYVLPTTDNKEEQDPAPLNPNRVDLEGTPITLLGLGRGS